MKVTLLGLPQAGQQQLFSLMTGLSLDDIISKPMEVHQGICDVKDPRIIKLKGIFNPKKTTFAKIEFLLLPDFDLSVPQKDLLVSQLKNADELCLVAREESVQSDAKAFVSELIIYDLMLAEKRLENIAKDKKRNNNPLAEKEKILIEKCKALLDQEKLLINESFIEDELKLLRTYQFLTLKPIIIVVNTQDAKAAKLELPFPSVPVSIEIEQEISQLEPAEQLEFMKELGISESAIAKMSQLCFQGLGLISFFTVGEDEVRAWPIPKGSSAKEAGSAIHTDIAKGFVRAEMMKYDDFIAAGSEAKLKEAGKFYLKGKEYVVEDSDLLSFRFNV